MEARHIFTRESALDQKEFTSDSAMIRRTQNYASL